MTSIIRSEWDREAANPAFRTKILAAVGLDANVDAQTAVAALTDKLEVRRRALELAGRTAIVGPLQAYLAADGIEPYADVHPALPAALAHEAYARAGDLNADEGILLGHAAEVFPLVANVLYEEQIRLASHQMGMGVTTLDALRAARIRLQPSLNVNAPDFAVRIWPPKSARIVQQFSGALDGYAQQRGWPLGAAARESAAGELTDLGLRPTGAGAGPEVAGLALGIALSQPGTDAVIADRPLDFVDFDDADDEQISAAGIEAMASLLYAETLRRHGVFAAYEEIQQRFNCGKIQLGQEANARLWVEARQAPNRMPAHVRDETLTRVIDDEFEATITRLARTVVSSCREGRLSDEAWRIEVAREVQEARAFLSARACGIVTFVAREASTVAIDAVRLFALPDVQSAFSGPGCTTDVLATIASVVPDFPRPPVETTKAWAGPGRKLISALAGATGDVDSVQSLLPFAAALHAVVSEAQPEQQRASLPAPAIEGTRNGRAAVQLASGLRVQGQ